MRERIPRACPNCGEELPRRRGERPRYSAASLALFVVGAVFTIVWAWFLLAASPIQVVPRGPNGVAICAVVYLGPGVVIAGIAAWLPKTRKLACRKCGWNDTVKV